MALSNKVCTVCYLIKFRFHKAEDLAYGYTVQCRRIFFQELYITPKIFGRSIIVTSVLVLVISE